MWKSRNECFELFKNVVRDRKETSLMSIAHPSADLPDLSEPSPANRRLGFRSILCLRLFPLANSTVTNLVCGASMVGFKEFIAATFLGFLPFTIVFATLGSSAAMANSTQMSLGLGLFVIVLAGRRLLGGSNCGSEKLKLKF